MDSRPSGNGELTFSQQELIDALTNARETHDNKALTTQEIADLLGVTPKTARKYMRPLVFNGTLVHVRTKRPTMSGVTVTTNGYKLAT